MLSSIDVIRQRIPILMFERRTANMQLPLWPTDEEPSQKAEVWQRLDPQDRAAAIAGLARLMVRMICSNNPRKSQEEKHE